MSKLAQLTGTMSIFLLFSIKLYIVANPRAWAKSGRIATLWTIMYVFFLFTLRVIQLLGLSDLTSLRILSGFSALIPLLAVCFHLFLFRNESAPLDQQQSLEEARMILTEAKKTRTEAVKTLKEAKKAR